MYWLNSSVKRNFRHGSNDTNGATRAKTRPTHHGKC